jgi:hypothetical protein
LTLAAAVLIGLLSYVIIFKVLLRFAARPDLSAAGTGKALAASGQTPAAAPGHTPDLALAAVPRGDNRAAAAPGQPGPDRCHRLAGGRYNPGLAGTELWDGKVSGLVVLDATDKTIVLRALVSAKDSGEDWDLLCHVREKLVEFLQREYPDCLPRIRPEVESLSKGIPSDG